MQYCISLQLYCTDSAEHPTRGEIFKVLWSRNGSMKSPFYSAKDADWKCIADGVTNDKKVAVAFSEIVIPTICIAEIHRTLCLEYQMSNLQSTCELFEESPRVGEKKYRKCQGWGLLTSTHFFSLEIQLGNSWEIDFRADVEWEFKKIYIENKLEWPLVDERSEFHATGRKNTILHNKYLQKYLLNSKLELNFFPATKKNKCLRVA